MNEFLMIFRSETPQNQPSPEEMQQSINQWQDWIGGIAAQGKFIGTNALTPIGSTVHADGVITDGPYTETKEIVGGYLLCKASSLEEAIELSKGCPTFQNGGKVEVRQVMQFDI